VPGGIGRYVTHLLDALPGAGVTPVPFAAGDLGIAGAVDLGWPRGPARYELWHRLRRPVVDLDADVVHAPSLAVPPTGRRPLVVTVADLVFLRQPEHLTSRGVSFHRRGLELARREAAALIAFTEFGRDDLAREGIDPARVHVAPLGVDAPGAPSDVPPPVAGPYLLFVSTLEPRKGIDDLLDAHAALRRRHPDVQLVLSGQPGWGDPPDTDRPGVVVGRLDDAALDSAYRHAIATVVPERYAGFGLPVIEAMARGCPVVTSDAACLPEVGGGVAAVVPVGDVGALTDVLDELVRSGARRSEMGRAGVEWAATFTWARCAERHAAAYRAALA
jgi:glycosyltransferase involved in cell wall biosynthesis